MAMAVNFNTLWNRARIAATSDEAESVGIMTDILSSMEGRAFIVNLEPSEAELCIEILHYGLVEHDLRAPQKQALFVALRRLAGRHGQCPESMIIMDEIDFSGYRQPLVRSAFTDIKQGWYCGRTVAVKIMRVEVTGDFEKIKKQFCKDIVLRNVLSHPNVLKLVGVLDGMEQGRFATVSEWTARGNIVDYISKNATNRLKLLHDAAQGLSYLHRAQLIHGALNGTNILITDDTPPKACLAELMVTTTASLNPLYIQTPVISALDHDEMIFMAPELLAPSKYGLASVVPTKEADIYAFGMLILQILAGEPLRSMTPVELLRATVSGVRPSKPKNAETVGISESLWKLIQKCWDDDRGRRPQIREVVAGVGHAATNWHTNMPPDYVQPGVAGAVDEPNEPGYRPAGAYQADEIPFPDPSTDTPGPGNAPTVPFRPAEEERRTCFSRRHTPPPIPIPLRKRKGSILTRFLASFRSKLKH